MLLSHELRKVHREAEAVPQLEGLLAANDALLQVGSSSSELQKQCNNRVAKQAAYAQLERLLTEYDALLQVCGSSSDIMCSVEGTMTQHNSLCTAATPLRTLLV
jgi:hypothetical protein